MLLAKKYTQALNNRLAVLHHKTRLAPYMPVTGLRAPDHQPALLSTAYRLASQPALAFQLRDSQPTRYMLASAPRLLNIDSRQRTHRCHAYILAPGQPALLS